MGLIIERHPRYKQECVAAQDYPELIRSKRCNTKDRYYLDDIVGQIADKCWKRYRKTQYHIKRCWYYEPKKDPETYARGMRNRGHKCTSVGYWARFISYGAPCPVCGLYAGRRTEREMRREDRRHAVKHMAYQKDFCDRNDFSWGYYCLTGTYMSIWTYVPESCIPEDAWV